MQVIELNSTRLQTLALPAPCVLALGFFDGVHRGHQRVIATAAAAAKARHLPLAVMTFDQHASAVFAKPGQSPVRYLTTIDQKAALMAALGVDQLYVVPFTRQFAALTPTAFVNDYLVGLNARVVVAGFDYTFGRGGTTPASQLRVLGEGRFATQVVARLDAEAEKISSTRIRHLIGSGALAAAEQLLGHPYRLALQRTSAGVSPCISQQLPPAGTYQAVLASGRPVTLTVSPAGLGGLPAGFTSGEVRLLAAQPAYALA